MCLGIQINIKYVNVSDDLVCIVPLFQTLTVLEQEDDINQITDFFSYEHFYVIYCKFWELDKDHDLFISKEDLARHNDHGIYPLWRLISYRNRVRGGCTCKSKYYYMYLTFFKMVITNILMMINFFHKETI